MPSRRGLPLNYFSAIFASNLSEMLFCHCGFVCLYMFMCALRSAHLHIFSYCNALFLVFCVSFRMAYHIVICAALLCIVIIWSGFILLFRVKAPKGIYIKSDEQFWSMFANFQLKYEITDGHSNWIRYISSQSEPLSIVAVLLLSPCKVYIKFRSIGPSNKYIYLLKSI